MLDVTSILAAWLAPIVIGIEFGLAIHLDMFNDPTVRPIPAAARIWKAE